MSGRGLHTNLGLDWSEDHYFDYAYDDVFFRYDAAENRKFKKFYGAEAEVEIEADSDFYHQAVFMYAARPVSKADYWKGKPKPPPLPPLTASAVFRRRSRFEPLRNVIYFESGTELHELAEGIDFEIQPNAGIQPTDWAAGRRLSRSRLMESGVDRALGVAEQWIGRGFVFFADDRVVGKPTDEVEKFGLKPETYVEYMRYVQRAMGLREVTKGLFLVDREPALWWEQTERGLEVTLTIDNALLSTVAGKVIRSELRQRQVPHESGIFPSLDA